MSRPFPLQPEVWTRTPHWGSRAMGFPPGEAAKSQKLQVLPARELISPFSAPPRIGDCDPLHSPGGKSLISPTWYGPSHSAFLRQPLSSLYGPGVGAGIQPETTLWMWRVLGSYSRGLSSVHMACRGGPVLLRVPLPLCTLARCEGRGQDQGHGKSLPVGGGTLTAWICGCTDSCSEPPLALLSWKTASVCLTKSFLLF